MDDPEMADYTMDDRAGDDLALVRTSTPNTPLPTAAELSPARTRLLAAIAEARPVGTAARPAIAEARAAATEKRSPETVVPRWDNGTGGAAQAEPTAPRTAEPTAPRTAGPAAARTAAPAGRRRKRGFLLAGGTTLVAAAAVAAALTLAPVDVVTGVEPPAASAAEVLHHAAAKARSAPFVEPRPDQFVHYRSSEGEQWMSVDGTRDSARTAPDGTRHLFPGCRDGVRQVMKGDQPLPGVTEECEPDPAYKGFLPTTADEMLAYLDANASGGPGNVNARGKDVMALARDLLKPASKAALFEAAARVPGLEVVRDTRDTLGRPAVGIAWPAPVATDAKPTKTVLFFDPATYEYLGNSWGPADEMSIVDEVGQRP